MSKESIEYVNNNDYAKSLEEFNIMLDMVLKNQIKVFHLLKTSLDKIIETQEGYSKMFEIAIGITKKEINKL